MEQDSTSTVDTPARLTNYARRAMWECDLLVVPPAFEPVYENHISLLPTA